MHVLWILVTVGAFVATALDILAVGGHNRNFAYFCSLTSSVGLFVGAALAITRPRHRSVLLGGAALAALALSALFVPDSKPGLLPWFVLVSCGAAAVLIASTGTRVDRLLAVSWLRYVGRRSYAIYLWSLPLDYALEQWVGISWRMDLLLLALAFVAAELSWRLVERRFSTSRARPDPRQDQRTNVGVASASAF